MGRGSAISRALLKKDAKKVDSVWEQYQGLGTT